MNRIEKFLSRLPKKDLRLVLDIITRLEKNDFANLDIKKLSGYKNLYRIRFKYIRIILLKEGSLFNMVSIERRSENTYNF